MHNTPKADQDTETKPTRDDQPPNSDPPDSSANVKAPFAPHEDDDSALGDTDQHSTA
jgi:hypothetical protein